MTNTAPQSAQLDSGETEIAVFRVDKTRYWRDHGIMALVLMALAGAVLWAIDSPYPAIGSLGAILAVTVRAAYLASEAFALRWTLTNRRLILPGGQRAIQLLEIETARILLGDVQVITLSGDKHLLKHLGDAQGVITQILTARDKRARRAGG